MDPRSSLQLKKPKSRSTGVSGTKHGRAQAMIEQLQARIEELEQERDSAKARSWTITNWCGTRTSSTVTPFPRGELVARLVAEDHYWVDETVGGDESKGYSATFIRADSNETLGENLSLEAAQELCVRHFTKVEGEEPGATDEAESPQRRQRRRWKLRPSHRRASSYGQATMSRAGSGGPESASSPSSVSTTIS